MNKLYELELKKRYLLSSSKSPNISQETSWKMSLLAKKIDKKITFMKTMSKLLKEDNQDVQYKHKA